MMLILALMFPLMTVFKKSSIAENQTTVEKRLIVNLRLMKLRDNDDQELHAVSSEVASSSKVNIKALALSKVVGGKPHA